LVTEFWLNPILAPARSGPPCPSLEEREFLRELIIAFACALLVLPIGDDHASFNIFDIFGELIAAFK
jgi:hypothetical protein